MHDNSIDKKEHRYVKHVTTVAVKRFVEKEKMQQ